MTLALLRTTVLSANECVHFFTLRKKINRRFKLFKKNRASINGRQSKSKWHGMVQAKRHHHKYHTIPYSTTNTYICVKEKETHFPLTFISCLFCCWESKRGKGI